MSFGDMLNEEDAVRKYDPRPININERAAILLKWLDGCGFLKDDLSQHEIDHFSRKLHDYLTDAVYLDRKDKMYADIMKELFKP